MSGLAGIHRFIFVDNEDRFLAGNQHILSHFINSVNTMVDKADLQGHKAGKKSNSDEPGYPLYPSNEDIFVKDKEEGSLNPEDTSKQKVPNEDAAAGKNNEKDFEEDASGGDLDVPGSELDDEQEKNGNEDEENNYYSLGGDNHNDLDEDQGG